MSDSSSIFARAYETYVRGRHAVSHAELEPILRTFLDQALGEPFDRTQLIASLRAIADFLTSQEGRTTAHLTAIDHFFCDWDEIWLPLVQGLPADIFAVINDIGIDLHGGLTQPDFHTTPEQLAEQVRRLQP